MPLCNGTDIGCVRNRDNITERESELTSLWSFTRENLTNRLMRQSRLRPVKKLGLIVWQRRIDQTVCPIRRSLRGWSGEATNRSKPSDNVPTRASVASQPIRIYPVPLG